MVRRHEMPKQHWKGWQWVTLILVLVCELMAHTWVRTESTQAMVRISTAQADIQKKRSYRRALGVERDRLNSEARITKIARTRMGLISDINNETVYLPGDRK